MRSTGNLSDHLNFPHGSNAIDATPVPRFEARWARRLRQIKAAGIVLVVALTLAVGVKGCGPAVEQADGNYGGMR